MIRLFTGHLMLLPAALLFCLNAFGQHVVTPDRNAVAFNDLFVNSAWSAATANPAQMDSTVLSLGHQQHRSWSAGIFSSRSFLLNELDEAGIALNMKLPASAAISTAFSSKGYELFRRSRAAVGLIKNFGAQLQVGLRFEYNAEVFGEGYGSCTSMRIVAGMAYKLTDKMDVAAVFGRPFRQGCALYPSSYAVGLQYRFSSQWTCSTQLISHGYVLDLGATFHYTPMPGLSFMAGVGGRPSLMALGCAVDCRRMKLFLSAAHRQNTGVTPSIGFSVPLP